MAEINAIHENDLLFTALTLNKEKWRKEMGMEKDSQIG